MNESVKLEDSHQADPIVMISVVFHLGFPDDEPTSLDWLGGTFNTSDPNEALRMMLLEGVEIPRTYLIEFLEHTSGMGPPVTLRRRPLQDPPFGFLVGLPKSSGARRCRERVWYRQRSRRARYMRQEIKCLGLVCWKGARGTPGAWAYLLGHANTGEMDEALSLMFAAGLQIPRGYNIHFVEYRTRSGPPGTVQLYTFEASPAATSKSACVRHVEAKTTYRKQRRLSPRPAPTRVAGTSRDKRPGTAGEAYSLLGRRIIPLAEVFARLGTLGLEEAREEAYTLMPLAEIGRGFLDDLWQRAEPDDLPVDAKCGLCGKRLVCSGSLIGCCYECSAWINGLCEGCNNCEGAFEATGNVLLLCDDCQDTAPNAPDELRAAAIALRRAKGACFEGLVISGSDIGAGRGHQVAAAHLAKTSKAKRERVEVAGARLLELRARFRPAPIAAAVT